MGALASSSGATEVWKWLGFVTAVWVQSISGNNYTFSNYSDALKSLMGLTQLQLNNLSVAKDVGKAFGLLAGLASDRLPTPALLLIGAIEGLIGYGAQWLVVRQIIPPIPYWKMCMFLCLGGNSSTWMNTAVLVTCIRNFRGNRGPVSGILKGYVGLSTAIFTDLCSAVLADDPASFLLMLAVIPAVICAIAMVFLRETPPSNSNADETESRYFGWINTAAVAIAVYLLVHDLTGDHGVIISRIFTVGLVVLISAPAIVPAVIWFRGRSANSNLEASGNELIREALIGGGEAKEKGSLEENEVRVRGRPKIGEEHTIWEAIRRVEFWVLFASFLCGVGTGLAVMNNMGQMGLAAGYSDVSIFISLISIWGFFGRIASGTASEHFLKKRAIPRPIWNAASQILMIVGYVVMAVALPGSLYVGSIIVGICYGVRIAVTVPIASELFGLKYYGLLYNILIINLPLGSFLFSGLLAGLLYDAQATQTPDGGNTCIGPHCYRLVFAIMAFACILGFGLDVLLTMITRSVYFNIHKNYKLKKITNGNMQQKPIIS